MDSLEINNTDGVVVHAGFPNAGGDNQVQSLSLQQLLVPRPISTFYFRLRGQDWTKFGIFDSDLLVIDRALDPAESDLVVWWRADQTGFMISRQRELPAQAQVWGCITSIIHQLRP